jgi:magnesium-transporting ATPase (P-type)
VITGDSKLVVRYIGQVVDLGEAKVLTGSEVNDLSDEVLWSAAETTTLSAVVRSRKSPSLWRLRSVGLHVVSVELAKR